AATVSLTVTPVNDAPVANDANATTPEDTPLIGTLVATDVDSAVLTFRIVTGATHGTVVLSVAGGFTYMPALDFNGSDNFTYVARDEVVDSNVATVSLTVTAVNDAPVAADLSASTAEDTPFAGNLAATDVDSPTLVFRVVTGPTHGTVVLASASGFTYTAAQDYNGSDSFTYVASDGVLDSDTATVSLTVTPVNDPPVARSDVFSTDEDTALTVAAPGVLGNDTDVDSAVLVAVLVAGPAHGALAFRADGGFQYVPAADF